MDYCIDVPMTVRALGKDKHGAFAQLHGDHEIGKVKSGGMLELRLDGDAPQLSVGQRFNVRINLSRPLVEE